MDLSIQKEELAALESAPDYLSRLISAEGLFGKHSSKALAEAPEFRRALTRFGTDGGTSPPEQRLRALALLISIMKGGKDLKTLAASQVKPLLAYAPSGLSTLANEKSRLDVCLLVSRHRAAWIPDYLAGEATRLLTTDKLRAVAVSGVVQNSVTWTDALEKIVAAISQAAVGAPDRDVMNVIRAVLACYCSIVTKVSLEPGAAFGATLSRASELIAVSSRAMRKDAVTAKAIGEITRIADVATALRPALLVDREVIVALTRARGCAAAGKWPASAIKHILAVTTRLRDAIGLLAAQGVAGRELFWAMETLGGSRESALKSTRAIAKQIEGLPERLVVWLTEGHMPAESGTNFGDSDDHLLATALLRASELLLLTKAAATATDSKLFKAIGTATAVEVEALSRRRGLEVYGVAGEVVEFSPLLHSFSGELAESVTKVRILVPGVRRRLKTEGTEIVLQALVTYNEKA